MPKGVKGFQKGHAKFGGRKAGEPNKITIEVRTAILEAFERVGGVDYLVDLAGKRPEIFVPLLAKVLPIQLAASTGGVPVVRIFAKPPTAEGQVIEASIEKKGDV